MTEMEEDVGPSQMVLAAQQTLNIAINATLRAQSPHGFQWAAMMPVEIIETRINYLQIDSIPTG
jgi:hypothetical protein